MKTPDQLRQTLDTFVPVFTKAYNILDAMKRHDLDAGELLLRPGCIEIRWHESYTKTRTAVLELSCSGAVCGIALDNRDVKKYWFVSNLCDKPVVSATSIVSLNLEETLEFIRHFLWANHDI